MVIEYAANAPVHAAMGNEEIIICPFFEARIVICIMRLARLPESSVEVRSVGIVRNGWVQIRAATEPAFGRDQKASVHMNGWHMGIGHVRHETDSCGEKLRIFIRAMTCLCKLRVEGAAACRSEERRVGKECGCTCRF